MVAASFKGVLSVFFDPYFMVMVIVHAMYEMRYLPHSVHTSARARVMTRGHLRNASVLRCDPRLRDAWQANRSRPERRLGFQ